MLLPIIELDMTQKNKVYTLPQATFSGEDNVYTIRLKPVNGDLDYDWTDKVAIIVFSAVPDLPKPLDVTDGVVSMLVNSAWVTAGLNRIQLNIYGTDGSIFNEHAPIVEWYVRQSLPVTDPPPERVNLIAHLLGQVTTTVDSLATVETTCTDAASAAAQSAEDADEDAVSAASALSQTLEAIGETIAPLGVDGKVPIENIPATAITKNVIITDEAERATIEVEQNDIASLVEMINGELTVVKAWQLMGEDKTDMDNWIVCGTSYAVQAGSAAQATAATNADKIDGWHIWGGTQAQYDALVIEDKTIYVVIP